MFNTEPSRWWRYSVVSVVLTGLGVLIWIAANTYTGDVGTPIPTRVVDVNGQTVFTSADIIAGQQVFQKHALMENGTIWGHGAHLGLGGMVVLNLFPIGVLQFLDAAKNGYWHARSAEFSSQPLIVALEWARMPADLVFILFGVVPLVIVTLLTYRHAQVEAAAVLQRIKVSGER